MRLLARALLIWIAEHVEFLCDLSLKAISARFQIIAKTSGSSERLNFL